MKTYSYSEKKLALRIYWILVFIGWVGPGLYAMPLFLGSRLFFCGWAAGFSAVFAVLFAIGIILKCSLTAYENTLEAINASDVALFNMKPPVQQAPNNYSPRRSSD